MRLIKTALLLTSLTAASTLFADPAAKTTHITCEPPVGTRIDYFTKNNAGIENNKFQMSRDKVSGVNPHIVFNSALDTVEFSIRGSTLSADSASSDATVASMKVIAYSDNQVTFAGIVNNAPMMATYYSKLNILIFSEQNIWSGGDLEGARATVFYSRCTEEAAHP